MHCGHFQLDIYLDSQKYLYLFVYIHDALQDILVPTPLYGTEFLQVSLLGYLAYLLLSRIILRFVCALKVPPNEQARNSSNFTRLTYMVTPEINFKLPRDNLPCYEVKYTN